MTNKKNNEMSLSAVGSKKIRYSTDSLGVYLQEIGRVPLLTRDEEITLGKQVKKMMQLKLLKADLEEEGGVSSVQWADAAQISEPELKRIIKVGERAREQMVKANLRLVVSIAKKYLNRNMDLLDLIQEGSIGLHRGVEKFDPSKGYRLSTYVYWWIRQAITRAIATKSRNIRIPIHIVEKINKIKKAQRKLSQSNHRTATLSELAQELEMDLVEVQRLKKYARKTISLDLKVGSAEGDSVLLDLLRDDNHSPSDYLESRSMATDIQTAISGLSDKEQEVIQLRFGLNGNKPLTLNAVGNALDISRERVRQIQKKALQRLRKYHHAELREYLAS